jgi:tRNA A37 threonylcarbamoyladenosine modification protein TsaB
MILYIDTTDNDVAKLVLTDGKKQFLQEFKSLPNAEDFAAVIKKFLVTHKFNFSDISKIAVRVGPGFFSRIRTGVVAANALAFGLGIKVIPVTGPIDLEKISKHKGQGMVAPVYGAKPHITKPRRI